MSASVVPDSGCTWLSPGEHCHVLVSYPQPDKDLFVCGGTQAWLYLLLPGGSRVKPESGTPECYHTEYHAGSGIHL